MRFVLDVDIGDATSGGKGAAELGRILRHWAGNLRHDELKPGDGPLICDSGYPRSAGEASRAASSGQAGDLDDDTGPPPGSASGDGHGLGAGAVTAR